MQNDALPVAIMGMGTRRVPRVDHGSEFGGAHSEEAQHHHENLVRRQISGNQCEVLVYHSFSLGLS